MHKPKYKTIGEMEKAAMREADGSVNMRLYAPTARPAKPRWLTVIHIAADLFNYRVSEGRKVKTLTRVEAATYLATEWEYAE
jgi:hypothetical protein